MNVKKYISVTLLCLFLVNSFTGCQSITDNQTAQTVPAIGTGDSVIITNDGTISKLRDSFRVETMEMPNSTFILNSITRTENGILAESSNENDFNILRFNNDFSIWENITPKNMPEEYYNADYASAIWCFENSGKIYTMLTLENHGGMKFPKIYDENFDYDKYYANTQTSYMVCSFSKDSNLLSSAYLQNTDLIYDDYGYLSIQSLLPTENDFLLSSSDKGIIKISLDGTVDMIVPYDDDFFDSSYLFYDRDGRIMLFCISYIDGASATIYEVNIDKKELGEPLVKSDSAYLAFAGIGEYRLFVPMSDSLYGLTDNGKLKCILNWNNSDIEQMELFPLENGEFIGQEYNAETEDMMLIRLIPRSMNELEGIKVITLAMLWDNRQIKSVVSDFNRSSADCRIQIVDYTRYNREEAVSFSGELPALTHLKNELITGNAPDIIITDDTNTIFTLGKKGAFSDLYDFMDNDSEINRETILPGIQKALEDSEGHLYSITPAFTIRTLTAKTSVCNKENWTWEDVFAVYDNASDNVYKWKTKTEMFELLLMGQNGLMNFEKGECYFDSPEFIQMLKFCNRFPDEVYIPDKFTYPDEFDEYIRNSAMKYRNDLDIINRPNFETEIDLSYERYETFGEPFTFVGYPSNNGKGGKIEPYMVISITNTCQGKQGAWEFIKLLLNKDISDVYGAFSPIRSRFEEMLDKTMSSDYFGGTDSGYIVSKLGNNIYPLTQKERDEVERYFLTCDSLVSEFDEDVQKICAEEVLAYFAGDKSAEETSKIIQNRVSNLVSERS